MGCTIAGHKTFLLVCNIALLFTGLTIFVLGVKMKEAMALLRLDRIEVLAKAIKAVIATGFVVTATSGTGFCGSCYEILWLLCVYLAGLGIIVVMEFSLGITLMVVKNSVENIIDGADCGLVCTTTLKSLVLDLAMPSAGIMMTLIIMQALMIYSGVKLFFYFRDKPKTVQPVAGPSVVVQNVQMQNVANNPPPPAQPYYPPPVPQYPSMPQCYLQPPPPAVYQPPVPTAYAPQPPAPAVPHPHLTVAAGNPPPYQESGSNEKSKPDVIGTSTPVHVA